MINDKLIKYYYSILIGISLTMLLMSVQTNVPIRFIFFVFAWLPLFINRYANKFLVPSVFLYSLVINDNLMEGVSFLPSSGSYMYYIFALLILLILNVSKYKNGASIGKNYFLVIVIYIYITIVDILNLGEVGRYSVHFLFLILIYPFLNTRRTIYYVLITYLLISVKLSIIMFVFKDQFAISVKDMDRYSWIDPNYFAATIGIGLVIALLFLLDNLKFNSIILKKVFLLIFIFLTLSTIIMSASRGAIVAVSFVVLLIVFFSKLKANKKIIFALIFLIIILIIFTLGYLDILIYRFLEEDTLNTGSYRTTIWEYTLTSFFSESLINQFLGSGFEYSYRLPIHMTTHNEFIGVLTDYGYIGIGLFVSLLIRITTKKDFFSSSPNLLAFYFVLTTLTLNPIKTIAFSLLLVVLLRLKEFNDANQIYTKYNYIRK